ncbi:TetR/AcrR family transcriptional regulator [bacterium]|nr:TetR/AcrR family transcriptional regulator [bacterium]
MRTKDEVKHDAIIQATIKLVNKIGFVSSSVSKIAKEAGVSPATLYIYYKNKEDLLTSTYVSIKQLMGKVLLKELDDSQPIRDSLKKIWLNLFDFTRENPEYFQFTEQFANSPYSDLVKRTEVEKYFEPLSRIVIRGIEQKIIKDISFDVLRAFYFHPAMVLSNARLCQEFKSTPENVEAAFNLAWDAIRL